ncbi:hypothetical protein SARC_05634 [Sphaeroforma arctica JP610]|uniref:Uncharacterized protein n=1 Tax=Sphaeroforma arctica JP610 TaxID=667725 RepID=A0A0L0G1N8_9EUKA|nr:hypothetical protein SARC_05634 [Sphaeroforma arctica JP610]KNC82083.1 hypothetical protein SARC_05634 [Sphaeroforma arctica JP610]|eukprot:XP_014155985.1 hypothetical protein SARC_05634 [Sphaeroforma arctica JP610]
MTAHDMRNAKGRRIAHVVLNAPVDENVDGQPKKANHMTDKSSVKGTDSASRAAAQPVYSGKSVTAGPTHKPGSMYETLEHIEHATRGFTLAYSKGFYSTTTSDPQMDQDCLHPIGIAMAKVWVQKQVQKQVVAKQLSEIIEY